MKFFYLLWDNTKNGCVETKHMSRVYDVVSALTIYCVFTVSVLQQHAEVPSIYFQTTASQTAPTNYPWERVPLPTVQEAVWAPGPFWTSH